MTSKEIKKHKKHALLIKPKGGDFHVQEWGIIGAPCSLITELATRINKRLGEQFTLGYLDAAHQAGDKGHEFHSGYIDRISHQSFTTDLKPQQKQWRKYFQDLSLLLVNGNHFLADKQIVIIDDRKKESLSRKTDRLKNVKMVLLQNSGEAIYPFLADYIPANTPMLMIDDIQGISAVIKKEVLSEQAVLNGLILAGGKSQRMGSDKGSLVYHTLPHRDHLAKLLCDQNLKTHISCRADQEIIESRYERINDTFIGLGPYGAILSAFQKHPNNAWLTIACDLPFIDKNAIQRLITNRNPNKVATCFHNPETAFPEPLITIWEPKAYPILLEFLSQGYSCPRKVLINSDIEELHIDYPEKLINANDPEAFHNAKQKLKEN